jgi:hypothetical protein
MEIGKNPRVEENSMPGKGFSYAAVYSKGLAIAAARGRKLG